MRTILSFVRKKNMLFKIILSYSLVGFLFITGFSYVIMVKVSNDLTNEVNETSSRMIEQSYNTADILLSSSYNYYSQLFLKNEWINSAMFGKAFTSNDIYKINGQLNNFKQMNPLVSSIYAYNYNKRIVFSSALTFSTVDNFFDKGMTDLLQQDNRNRQGIFIPRKAIFTFPNSTGTGVSTNLITIVYSYLRPDGNQDSMVVNLDQNVLQELVMKGSRDGNYKMLIVNDQGSVISHPEGDMFQGNDSPRKIMESTARSAYMRMWSALGKKHIFFILPIRRD